MTEIRVPIPSTRAALSLGIDAGLRAAVGELEALPENARALSGFQLALATVRALAATTHVDQVHSNMRTIAAGGVDLTKMTRADFDGDAFICYVGDKEELGENQ